ncbi:DUF924 family protein [Thaumasiovibrio sp. DFM-14]|uniref:DUF924 family protein n=1 Tax=Thaumasiovibrio sp. DFM-14 TaxID=3384792 RepID=UPI0039A13662
MQSEYEPILDFWFGEMDGEVTRINRNKLWFGGDEESDTVITEKFREWVSRASLGQLSDWCETPRGTLALIILLDQFSRNIYRGLSAAFRHDPFALAICRKGLSVNFDQALMPIERVFFYLPLQHSESLDDQEESIFRFDQLRKQVSPDHKQLFEGFYQYALRHYHIVRDFGRFPHRNAACGRLSTLAEMDWLAVSGERFGQ